MSKPIVVLVASAVVVLFGIAVAGAALVPAALHDSERARPQTSTLNTASQKSLGNSAAFGDVTDNPVSLPSERTIQPPRTGNAGLLTPRHPLVSTIGLLAVALGAVTAARLLTRARHEA